ncbi:hypothetical protein JL469_000653 [Salmonella enterica]|nr:hypothetical protein [Salmonella enterica]EHA5652569.1 hypothetical protein [Salmonella enterica]
MQLINLTRYEPEDKKYGENAIYLIDESGLDWYSSQSAFTGKYKLAVDSSGLIRSCAEDVSTLYPLNHSVTETDYLPDGFTIETMLTGAWGWDGSAIVAYSTLVPYSPVQSIRKTVSQLSLEAFALQCAVDAGTASQEQIETLAALKQNIAERIGENNEVNK